MPLYWRKIFLNRKIIYKLSCGIGIRIILSINMSHLQTICSIDINSAFTEINLFIDPLSWIILNFIY